MLAKKIEAAHQSTMKNRLDPLTKFIIRRLLIVGLIFAAMYYFFVSVLLTMGNELTIEDTLFSSLPPETVPSRNIIEINNLELLWMKEMNIDNPHRGYVDLFIPNEASFVFWSPQSDSLVSLAFATGDVLWETAVPRVGELAMYDGAFYVASYDWLNKLNNAPKDLDGSFYSCSFAGEASLVAINATTGQQTWGYSYLGADDNKMVINQENIYLTGSQDHGASRSLVRIDTNSGTILERDCYRWPKQKELTQIPVDESWHPYPSPYVVVLQEHKESQLSREGVLLFFVAQENRLDILDGQTKEIVGSVNFDGADLNPWDIDVAVQGNIAVVYFGDSHQLFGFSLQRLGN